MNSCARVIGLTFAAALLLLVPQRALLAEETAQISVPFESKPKAAIGIIFSGDQSRQERRTTFSEPREDGTIAVSIPFSEADREAQAFATAFVVGDDGTISFGDVVTLANDTPDNAYVDLPRCDARLDLPDVGEEQLGNLEKLVEVRDQRRGLVKTKIARRLQGTTLERLRKLEQGFGLTNAEPINPGMNPVKLSDRLTRLRAALENYEISKKK